MTRRATLYARTESYFESRMFDDEEAWEGLPPKERQAFTDRLTRSVVWSAVGDVLEEASRLTLVPAQVKDVVAEPVSSASRSHEVVVQVAPLWPEDAPQLDIPAALVVDASGFDAWWFADLLPRPLRTRLREESQGLMAGMSRDLSFQDPELRGLHAPFVSSVVGPGFTSLMVLGRMADRILGPYVWGPSAVGGGGSAAG